MIWMETSNLHTHSAWLQPVLVPSHACIHKYDTILSCKWSISSSCYIELYLPVAMHSTACAPSKILYKKKQQWATGTGHFDLVTKSTTVTFYCTTEKRVSVEYNMRSKIFVLLMLFTPGILGIPTPDMETNGFEDDSTGMLITADVLQANESSVDIYNGVSAKLLCDMYIYS